jgi:catechol 2,3-dioxygenase-like lactoylglutathione lyase family enzyme
MIKGLAHVCYNVEDLDRAIAFYAGALGMKEAFDFLKDDGTRYGVYLSTGGRQFIELFEGPVTTPEGTPSYKHLCLEVEDIESAVTALKSAGIETSEPKLGSDQSWQVWITDPDGNRIELHAYTPDSRQTPFLA